MKKFFLALAALSLSFTAFAAGDDDAFYGKIEKMPSAQNPTWVIGGKTFKADARTKVESHGGHKFDVGACVKVEGDIDHRGEFSFPRWKSKMRAAAINKVSRASLPFPDFLRVLSEQPVNS